MPDVNQGSLVTRYFKFADITPRMAWDLLEWCVDHGANELTIASIVTEGSDTRRVDAFLEALGDRLPSARRRTLKDRGIVPLWQLSDSTIGVLRSSLPDGFASRRLDENLEDLTVYRNGMFMMGVSSIEQGGAVRVTEKELTDLRRIGFAGRKSLKWIELGDT